MVFGAPPSCSDISVLTAPTSYVLADLSVGGWLWAPRKNLCSVPADCVGGQRSEEELRVVELVWSGLVWTSAHLTII